jgi:hypothetical protein
VLLGWMPREAALSFLRNDCAFDPPLDEVQAEALWRLYRARVEALPARPTALPELLPLDEAEQAHARQFRAFLAQQGIGEVQDVVKLDLAELVATQHFVVAERSQSLAQGKLGPGDWMSEFLPLALRGSSVRYSFRRTAAVTTCIDFELPHAEFLFQPNPQLPGGFCLIECLHHATVMFGADRCFLGTGYHRSFARLLSAAPGERATALVARVPNTVAGDAGDPLSPLGSRAARFRDFLEEGLYLEADLVMRRFQLQLTARVVALNERRNKARAQGRATAARATAGSP